MVAITSNKSIRGLDLNNNPLVATPGKDLAGSTKTATTIAENCVLSRQRMLGNRRGFDFFTRGTSAPVDKMLEYQNQIIEHQTDGTLWNGDATTGTRTQYTGSFPSPTGYIIDGTVSRGNMYMTTSAGVYKLDSVTATPALAGITKGLDVRVVTLGGGAGFMTGYSKCAYRITWLRTDANNQQVRSDVSSRYILTNNTRVVLTSLTSSAGTATATTATAHGWSTGYQILISGAVQSPYNGTVAIVVTGANTFTYIVAGGPASPATTLTTLTAERQMDTTVSFTVPFDVRSGDYYEIWRTATKDASNADPGDDCYLVSKTLNAGAAGSTVSVNDTTPDDILTGSLPLYTNATQEGALQGNSQPPVCSAIATYKDYTIYANAAVPHQLTLNLLAVINLVSGSSKMNIVNAGGTRPYTFGAAENTATQTAQLYTGGLSNALNIENTIRSLVHVINGDSGGNHYAEYTSGPNDNPGIFRIWARTAASGSFWMVASDSTTGNQFSPAMPTSGATVPSSNDARQNRIYVSKYQQPDSVPVLNTIDAGRLDQPILKVLSVRDACYIVKQDGIFYLSGLTFPFNMIELDTTCHCIAPNTAVTLNNQLYLLSNQGVVKISTSGVTVISFDIEPVVMGTTLTLPNLATTAFGVAHEADRAYMLYLPSSGVDTYCKTAYCYHTFIQEWTTSTKSAYAGVVLNSNYSLYLSSGIENAVLQQRRTGANSDYSDEELAITVNSQTGFVVDLTWTQTLYTPTVGVTLHQGAALAKVIAVTQISGTHWTFTIDRSVTYSAGAATARMPIYSHIRLSPNPLSGETGMVKDAYAVAFLLLNDNTVSQASIELATNEAALMYTYPITRTIVGGFGTGAWDTSLWGDTVSTLRSVPWQVDFPVPDITGEYVTVGWVHGVSQEPYALIQVSYEYDTIAEYEATA